VSLASAAAVRPLLSERDIAFYRTYGFIVVRQVLAPDEMATLGREIEHAMNVQYPHKPYDGSGRHWTMMIQEDTPLAGSLVEDPRFLGMARTLYGDDVLGAGVDANRFTGDTSWHRESLTVQQYGMKIGIYFDSLDGQSGALRLLPGSHATLDQTPLHGMADRFAPAEVPAYVCSSEPGDVVAFDLRMWHGSVGGGKDRRMCAVVYYANPKTPAEREALVAQARENPRTAFAVFGCQRKYLYSKAWLANPGRNPDRQRWIERFREIGYFDQPGVVEGGPAIVDGPDETRRKSAYEPR
jgi:hypothetical protein